ncbi:hypothetical protein [Azospirillum sp. A39]|uniref:hypothetical protein n=1 Tax=Azospirillum sp. A39 TaxID=3462279 RepID=UPI004045FAEE
MLGWMCTPFFVLLGPAAAVWGGWLEHAGPQGGTGLGLSISYTLVARAGGRMAVASEPGPGRALHRPAAGPAAGVVTAVRTYSRTTSTEHLAWRTMRAAFGPSR